MMWHCIISLFSVVEESVAAAILVADQAAVGTGAGLAYT